MIRRSTLDAGQVAPSPEPNGANMSNRIKGKPDRATRADVKGMARCPDCAARVRVSRRGDATTVRHDDTCPTLAALRRTGRDQAVALFPRQGGTVPASLAADVAALAHRPVRIRTDLYAGLTRTTSPTPRTAR